jgi:hypothetical protein
MRGQNYSAKEAQKQGEEWAQIAGSKIDHTVRACIWSRSDLSHKLTSASRSTMLVTRCTKLMPSSSIRQAKPMENFTKSRMIQRLSLNKLGKRHKKISTRRLRISTRRLRGKRSKRRTGFLVGLALGASNAELSSAVLFWIIDSSFKIWHQGPADCISICTHTLVHLLTSMLCLS